MTTRTIWYPSANHERAALLLFDVLLVGGLICMAFLPYDAIHDFLEYVVLVPLIYFGFRKDLTRLDLLTFVLLIGVFVVFAFSAWVHAPNDDKYYRGAATISFWVNRGFVAIVIFARLLLMRNLLLVLRITIPLALVLNLGALTVDQFSDVAGTGCRIKGFTELPFTPATIFGSYSLFYFALWQHLSKAERMFAVTLVAGSILVAMGYTGSRGVLLGLLTGWFLVGGTMLKFRSDGWKLGAGGIVVGAVVGIAASAILDPILGCSVLDRVGRMAETVLNPEAVAGRSSIGLRLQFWAAGWQAILDAPIFGSGRWSEISFMDGTGHDHVHQQYLSWMIWFGIPGLLAGLGMLCMAVPSVWAKTRGFERWMLLFATTSCFPIALLFDTLLRFSEYLLFQGTFVGLVFVYLRDPLRQQPVASAEMSGAEPEYLKGN